VTLNFLHVHVHMQITQYVADQIKHREMVSYRLSIVNVFFSISSEKCDRQQILFLPCCDRPVRDRPFNLKGGLWFFVFRFDNTRVRIFIFFVAQSAKFFSRI
jgi:hypothetical protein